MQITQIKTTKLFSAAKTDLLWTAALVIAAAITPAILAHTPQNQWLTGTVVNLILFISAWKLGIANAFLVAVLPSSIALMRGLLLPPQVIMIPFIILSNLLLILVFSQFKKRLFLGILTASFIKFFLLAGISSLFFAKTLPIPMLQMMQWPQLITALAGGLLTLPLIKQLSRQ